MEEQTDKNLEKIDTKEVVKTDSDSPFVDWLSEMYKKFNLFSEIKKTDHITIMIGKVIIRIVGFIFLLILSPFLFIGLMVAFAFAG